MEEDVDYEVYAPEFDVIVKVSSEMPSGRSYYMELAKELYRIQAIDLETLWDVMEDGKFPPKDIIMQRLQNGQAMPPCEGDIPPGGDKPAPGQPQGGGRGMPAQGMSQQLPMMQGNPIAPPNPADQPQKPPIPSQLFLNLTNNAKGIR